MNISRLIEELQEAQKAHGDIPVAWEAGSGYIFGEGQFGIETDVTQHEHHYEYDGPALPKVFVISSDCEGLWEKAEKQWNGAPDVR